MRYVKTKNQWKGSNFFLDLNTLEAYSYNWWLFNTVYNGKKIFNNAFYSVSTRRHQSRALSLLGYNSPDIVLSHTKESLESPRLAIGDEIEWLRMENRQLKKEIRNPRTHKPTNLKRSKQILANIKRIKELDDFLKDDIENFERNIA